MSDWTVTQGVDDGRGGLKTTYKWKGKDALRHALNTHKSRHLGGYKLVAKDLRNITSWLNAITKIKASLGPDGESRKRQGDPEQNDLLKALLVACLSIYGKLFNTAKGRLVKLEEKILKEPAHKEWHKRLIELRNSFASHSGEEKAEACEVVWAFHIESGQVHDHFFCELTQPNHLSNVDYKEIHDLINFLYSHAKAKCDELEQAVAAELTTDEINSILQLHRLGGSIK